LRSTLVTNATADFEHFLTTDFKLVDREEFFRSYAMQLHHTMVQCKTVEDIVIAQQQAIQMQVVFTWTLNQADSGNENYQSMSRVLDNTKLSIHSMENILALGQRNVEMRCKRLVGMAMGHGTFKEMIDIWMDPSLKR
jgi:hypothetical protein